MLMSGLLVSAAAPGRHARRMGTRRRLSSPCRRPACEDRRPFILHDRFRMTIQIGDRIPEVVLKYIDDGVQAIDTPTLFDGSKVVLFAVPGAFTPTCSERHLPGFIERFDRFRELGVEVACMAVNDPFVMQAWGES